MLYFRNLQMVMPLRFFFVFLASSIALLACWGQPTLGEDAPFKAAIAIHKPYLNSESYKKPNLVFVDTTVKNVSKTNQRIVSDAQYGRNWTSDNSDISPDLTVAQNYPDQVTILKPGQDYQRMVQIWVAANKRLPVTFRLEFYSVPNPDAMENNAEVQRRMFGVQPHPDAGGIVRRPSAVPIWSNPVTLTK